MDMNTGILTVHYEWNSSSGELEDLEGQSVIEVITYDPDAEFETDVLSFLCTGQTESSEKLALDPPWDELGQVPRIWRGGSGSEAEDGSGIDTHTRPNRPSGCGGQCSYTSRQWYVARKNGGQDYKVGGPYEITRSFEYFQGAWIYTIEKHGEQRWVVVP